MKVYRAGQRYTTVGFQVVDLHPERDYPKTEERRVDNPRETINGVPVWPNINGVAIEEEE